MGKINKIKYGAMGNMVTDGVIPSRHNKNINKEKQPLESSAVTQLTLRAKAPYWNRKIR